MTAPYLIRMPLAPAALGRWAAERELGWTLRRGRDGRLGNATFDEGRALHHLLAETFGKGALQPFRLLVTPRGRRGNLYAYSHSDVDALRETARSCALPEALQVCDLAGLEGKLMPGEWRAGRRLGFDIRICPVRRLHLPLPRADGRSFAKGSEVDTFLLEALRRFPAGAGAEESMLAEGRTRAAVYADWLGEQLRDAAEVQPGVQLAQFLRRRLAREGQGAEKPDAVLHGALLVRDPERFATRLAAGIGRHRAYGFGMLLLRPAGQG